MYLLCTVYTYEVLAKLISFQIDAINLGEGPEGKLTNFLNVDALLAFESMIRKTGPKFSRLYDSVRSMQPRRSTPQNCIQLGLLLA